MRDQGVRKDSPARAFAADLRSVISWHQRGELWFPEYSHWWRDSSILAGIGPALADLFRAERPTVVVGIEAHGILLGPLAALSLEVGFAIVRKGDQPDDSEDRLIARTTPPDYKHRSLNLSIRRSLLRPEDRVVLVDDWIETGSQASAVRSLVDDAEATWLGVAAAIDGATPEVRRQLTVRSLLHERAL
ncbi:phosphoribosyltransferase family protein [Catellatospora chokoriensis]|uniref:phosphoribosyltransferase family protein n=1 Tax=Catellatospora chokoriensis TaxID=310353 RepID=UPI0017807E87|nr:phosphoribosyltransferase family protein [Catellatospora chokoriensis]